MKKVSDYYYIGYNDGVNNLPKRKNLKGDNFAAYKNGYKEGHQNRSRK